ncbi:polysaccharide biosynthesis tyrosine autokinase [Streptomyces sp. NBC_01353]|uniref:polysaccharide biosynthesis tyrosine autokinase n=1 Tax=Streptomyces sp. NBC_01353 TaxID=2903835 RepID=UPI002E2F9EDB|nr:polysaccharide biosynthesis tyrosine autokinase [Streptomyces sp. NBC_01353]
MDLRGYIKLLARRWPTVLICLLLGIVAAEVVTAVRTPVYEARTQLFVATRTGADTSELNQGQSFSQARVQSYSAIVATRQVTQPVVRQLKLPYTPTELASRITAEAPLNTVLINIKVRDTDPARAALIADAVADRFVGLVERLETPKKALTSAGKKESASPVSPVSLGVTEKAAVPKKPVSPNRLLGLALGVLGGLLLGAGIVALREALDTTVKTSEALGELTSLPVLGSIPYDRSAGRKRIAIEAASTSARAEAFRKLRANLQFAQVDDPPRVIVVTSPLPGEGKTTTSVNLALSLADAGLRTCLVDADLRRPSVAPTFGLVEGAGLTTVLIGQARIEDVVQEAAGRLAVLTSGTLPPNPTELLSCGRMAEVLRELADTYDIVIVDSAPLLPVADTLGLSPLTDGVLLVVSASKTGRDQIVDAAGSLSRIGVPVIGTTLNMSSAYKGKGYGYGYGYAPAELPMPRPATDTEEPASATTLGTSEEPASPTTLGTSEEPASPTTHAEPKEPASPTTLGTSEEPASPTAVGKPKPASPTTVGKPKKPASPTAVGKPKKPASRTTVGTSEEPASPTTVGKS